MSRKQDRVLVQSLMVAGEDYFFALIRAGGYVARTGNRIGDQHDREIDQARVALLDVIDDVHVAETKATTETRGATK
jgi:hypothetical protein